MITAHCYKTDDDDDVTLSGPVRVLCLKAETECGTKHAGNPRSLYGRIKVLWAIF